MRDLLVVQQQDVKFPLEADQKQRIVKAGKWEADRFVIEQHYGFNNELVKCEASMKLAKSICAICNEVYKKLQAKKAA